ncbi:hypothetical protein AAEU32_13760 [Pseudoalteromonas sp. SSDWG2]|uniref:hypothetical protein n=1 Tax=Pseudoalteromonas sp. SSDWG2 TaxID=3139391 RepID=UPI003BABB4B6
MHRSRRHRPTPAHLQQYIEKVVDALRNDPTKLSIIRANLQHYRQQPFLKRGFLTAIERFDWVFAAHQDVEQICSQILSDDYIGKRLRRYPLLFKGVLDD